MEQLIEAFRDNVVCASDIEAESEPRNRDVYSIIFNILPQMHQHDTVLLFTTFNGDENLSSLVIIDKLVQKEITVSVIHLFTMHFVYVICNKLANSAVYTKFGYGKQR